MNPPDYYPVPAELLEAARLAIIKYLASEDVDSLKAEALTTMLMGGDWVKIIVAESMFTGNKTMYNAFLYFLPSEEEEDERTPHESHTFFMKLALECFRRYLDEPQNP